MDNRSTRLAGLRLLSLLGRHNIAIVSGILLAASLFFFVDAQRIRAITNARNPEAFKSGDIIYVEKVVDGDEILVVDAEDKKSGLRLLGIKSFRPSVSDPLLSEYGKICFQYLKAKCEGKKALIELDPKKVDVRGRLLGQLFLEDRDGKYTVDVGLDLVRRGYTVVYTRYDFSMMADYLVAEDESRAQNAGFWSNERIAARAASLQLLWKEKKND